MNGVVHRHKVDATAGAGGVRVPAEQQHGGVVVPVQEHQRFLAKNDEDRVDQLKKLREVHEHDPSAHRPVRPGEFFGGANGLLERLRQKQRNQVGCLRNELYMHELYIYHNI